MSNEPLLEMPGAGVPKLELLVIRYMLYPLAGLSDWERNWLKFKKVNDDILDAIHNLSDEALEQRVLISRLTGLEDSSRYWSIAMTLEHLIIVNTAIQNAIFELAAGHIPANIVSIANVKPTGKMSGSAQVNAFKSHLLPFIRPLQEIKAAALASPLKYAHPWFGPMTAKQWQWLLGAHTQIHLKQIIAIKADANA